MNSVVCYPANRWHAGNLSICVDPVAEEIPVALIYNGMSHAVMMASPDDLSDFAFGFSLTEGIIRTLDDVLALEQRSRSEGIELALTIAAAAGRSSSSRAREFVGRTGCGLCGVRNLASVARPMRAVGPGETVTSGTIARAMASLPSLQQINREAGAVHAAAWALPDGTITSVREDVGRHNALDKLIGAMARGAIDPGAGFAVITSRCSYEMVQKAVMAGIGIIAAVSAPTGMALRLAEQYGVTIVAWARDQRHTLYTHPERVVSRTSSEQREVIG